MAEMAAGKLVEFVEARQPPFSRDERWILMVSTLFGCPVACRMCDAGGRYVGKPTAEEILAQIDFMVDKWCPDRRVSASKFKIQLARMGEPTLNPAVLTVLEALPLRYHAPGLMPSLSTIAPKGAGAFLDRLIDIKDQLYANGRFQFQFVPARKWDFAQMAAYGDRFRRAGDRKITLNFALAAGMPVDPDVLLRHFDPAHYLIKITPLNPTYQAMQNGLASYVDPNKEPSCLEISAQLAARGYEVIVSIGAIEENQVGSNCGQYVLNYLASNATVEGGYALPVQELAHGVGV
jgi:23S rRNA (adenine2503-C2)-methyltransferase